MDRYEVFPDGDEWNWRCGDTSGDGYPNRSEAIAAAKDARGDTTESLYREDGSLAGSEISRGPEAIVLLRPDGTVHGELSHALKAGGPPQRISIKPAGETTEASGG